MRAAESRTVLAPPCLFCSPLQLDRGHNPSRLSSVMRNHGSATIADSLIVARRRRRRRSALGKSRKRGRNEMRKEQGIDRSSLRHSTGKIRESRTDRRLADGATECAVCSVAAQAGRIGMCRSVVIAASPSQAGGGVVCGGDDPTPRDQPSRWRAERSCRSCRSLSQTRRLLACSQLETHGKARAGKGKQGPHAEEKQQIGHSTSAPLSHPERCSRCSAATARVLQDASPGSD